ncbi:hypothetical protein BH11PSE8_BH11PSE8_10340 [soil metagenome]
MKHLAGLDASFLFLESPEMPVHVGVPHQFEMPADFGGDYLEDVRAHMAPGLALSAPLRQRLTDGQEGYRQDDARHPRQGEEVRG